MDSRYDRLALLVDIQAGRQEATDGLDSCHRHAGI